ncbi:NUDIX hydrolase [Paenibacillus chungangensis]|uniref:NUDIX hydrolase n=1 Tax=Paenibacillus chungangensis TaxID=696535 RepID=A0ABW3HQA4_9BACL
MKLLKEIYERELQLSQKDISYRRHGSRYWLYRDSRAVIRNHEGKAALIHRMNADCYTLPGGGIREGEDALSALKRGIMEEIGSKIQLDGELGLIIEYRDEQELMHFCYGYAVHAEKTEETQLVELLPNEDVTQHDRLLWLNLEEAITTMAEHQPNNYTGKFVQMRDSIFLQYCARV